MKSVTFFGLPKRLSLITLRRVVGASMEPTLSSGQIVVVAPRRRLAKGDVVLIHHDGIDKIKRITDIRRVGKVLEIYMLGDNLSESTDSRAFGWLAQEHVIGKVVWPRIK